MTAYEKMVRISIRAKAVSLVRTTEGLRAEHRVLSDLQVLKLLRGLHCIVYRLTK